MKQLAAQLRPDLEAQIKKNNAPAGDAYSPDFKSVARRTLKNKALSMLATLKEPSVTKDIMHRFQSATNMTDRLSALSALANLEGLPQLPCNVTVAMPGFDCSAHLLCPFPKDARPNKISILRSAESISLSTEMESAAMNSLAMKPGSFDPSFAGTLCDACSRCLLKGAPGLFCVSACQQQAVLTLKAYCHLCSSLAFLICAMAGRPDRCYPHIPWIGGMV